MNRKRSKLIILLLVIIFFTISGIYIYIIPYKVVNSYIINYNSDEPQYSESISRFLAYNKEKNLPESTIRLKMINRSMNEGEILASFEIFTYGIDNVLTKVYSGNLLFSLVRNKWTWEIDTIAVIKDIES